MKTLKKISCFALSFIMAISLTACGSSNDDKFFELLDEYNSFDDGKFHTEIVYSGTLSENILVELNSYLTDDITIDEIVNYGFVFDGYISDDSKSITADIDFSFNGTDYTNLTDIVIKDNKLYYNSNELFKSLLSSNEFRNILNGQLPDEIIDELANIVLSSISDYEYVEIDLSSIGINDFNMNDFKSLIKNSSYYKHIDSLYRENIKSVEPSLINKDEYNNYKLSLSNKFINETNKKSFEYLELNSMVMYDLLYNVASYEDGLFASKIYNIISSKFYDKFETYPESNKDALKMIFSNKDAIIAAMADAYSIQNNFKSNSNIDIIMSKANNSLTNETSIVDGENKLTVVSTVSNEETNVVLPENIVSKEDFNKAISKNGALNTLLNLSFMENSETDKNTSIDINTSDILSGSNISEDAWYAKNDIKLDEINNLNIILDLQGFVNKNQIKDYIINYVYGAYEIIGYSELYGLNIIGTIDPYFGNKDNNNLFSMKVECKILEDQTHSLTDTDNIKHSNLIYKDYSSPLTVMSSVFEDNLSVKVNAENVEKEFIANFNQKSFNIIENLANGKFSSNYYYAEPYSTFSVTYYYQ